MTVLDVFYNNQPPLVDTGEIQGEWIAGRRLVARDPAHVPNGLRGQHEQR